LLRFFTPEKLTFSTIFLTYQLTELEHNILQLEWSRYKEQEDGTSSLMECPLDCQSIDFLQSNNHTYFIPGAIQKTFLYRKHTVSTSQIHTVCTTWNHQDCSPFVVRNRRNQRSARQISLPGRWIYFTSWTLQGYTYSHCASRIRLLSPLNLSPRLECSAERTALGQFHPPRCLPYKCTARSQNQFIFKHRLAGVQGRVSPCVCMTSMQVFESWILDARVWIGQHMEISTPDILAWGLFISRAVIGHLSASGKGSRFGNLTPRVKEV
jgi:hypothetical protein